MQQPMQQAMEPQLDATPIYSTGQQPPLDNRQHKSAIPSPNQGYWPSSPGSRVRAYHNSTEMEAAEMAGSPVPYPSVSELGER